MSKENPEEKNVKKLLMRFYIKEKKFVKLKYDSSIEMGRKNRKL